jgi:hypothetical protein
MYLISFKYEYYHQGYRWGDKTLLVYAPSFDLACEKIKQDLEYNSACNFKNLTIT